MVKTRVRGSRRAAGQNARCARPVQLPLPMLTVGASPARLTLDRCERLVHHSVALQDAVGRCGLTPRDIQRGGGYFRERQKAGGPGSWRNRTGCSLKLLLQQGIIYIGVHASARNRNVY